MNTTWASIYSNAKEAGAKFPECVAAQWALESNFGKHTSGRFNYFGQKGTPGTICTTQEWVNGKFVTISATFKDYNSPKEAVIDLVNQWYKDYKNYKGINRAKTREECAQLLETEGYATDPRYSNKLVDLMNRYQPMTTSTTSSFEGFLRKAAQYYQGEPHQDFAYERLEKSLTAEQLEQFKEDYRNKLEPIKPKFPLEVPYFYQRDSGRGHGERMCFSSAMAMAMDYLDPDSIAGDDDWYLTQVFKYGDTVSSTAQIAAARSLGFSEAEFSMNGSEQDLIELLDAGIPVPIGILHRGPISKPSGGGHWITLIGYTATHFYTHDPYGELDLINGGYPVSGPNAGRAIKYSRKNLMKRWLIHSKNDGWYVCLEQP